MMSLGELVDNFFSLWPFSFSPVCLNVTFELTYACNLNCAFCYLRREEKQKKLAASRPLNKKQIFQIIDRIPSHSSIAFTGGEPFLIKDFLSILKYAKRKHRTSLITNLTRNTPLDNQALVAMELDSLLFSLDGDKQTHDHLRGRGSFQKTVKNIFQIQAFKHKKQAKKPWLTMNTVLMSSNIKLLAKMVEIAADLKVDYLNFQLWDPSLDRTSYLLKDNLEHLTGNLDKIARIEAKILERNLKKALKKARRLKVKLRLGSGWTLKQVVGYYQKKVDLEAFYCPKLMTYTKVSPQGEMNPCLNLRIGSLLENDFYQLYNCKKYQNFRRLVKSGRLADSCLGCCQFRLKK